MEVLALPVVHQVVLMGLVQAQVAVAAHHQKKRFEEIENKSIYLESVDA
jgi:hypothetical protein